MRDSTCKPTNSKIRGILKWCACRQTQTRFRAAWETAEGLGGGIAFRSWKNKDNRLVSIRKWNGTNGNNDKGPSLPLKRKQHIGEREEITASRLTGKEKAKRDESWLWPSFNYSKSLYYIYTYLYFVSILACHLAVSYSLPQRLQAKPTCMKKKKLKN